MKIGDVVFAVDDVVEQGFEEDGVDFTHALAGARGVVVDECDGGFVMVRWDATESVTQCSIADELWSEHEVPAKHAQSAVAHPMGGFLRLVS